MSLKSRKKRMIAAAAAAIAVIASLAGCSNSGDSSQKVTVSWWNWDATQAAAYAKCIPGFEKANPDISVKMTQYQFSDLWTKITAGFVGGTAPDTFQDIATYSPEYVKQGQLLPLNSYIDSSHFDMDKYSVGLNQWGKFPDGNYYGLPKDYSTLGFYYNKTVLDAAGISQSQLDDMTWNPNDGGSFEKIIAHLTVDDKGVRGDEPGFDKQHVKVYGTSTLEGGGLNGQGTWDLFANTTGWKSTDKQNYPTSFNFNDPRFLKTVAWIKDVTAKGYAPAFNQFTTGTTDQLGSGAVALVQDGSWNISSFGKLPGVKLGVTQGPVGPNGHRTTLANSTADSIWKGTKHPEQAWKWISYMGSESCQSLAASTGTFLPSIAAAGDSAAKVLAKQGTDIAPFTSFDPKTELWSDPIFNGGTAIQSTLVPMTESYWTGAAGPEIWKKIDQSSATVFAQNK